MKISTKGRYALRVLLDLAEHASDGYIPLKTIAARQEISKSYLDQIMMILNKTDYLDTTIGLHGGYRLAKKPDQYIVGDLLRLTEGSFALIACLEGDESSCSRHCDCKSRKVWQGLGAVIAEYLDHITLQDILDDNVDAGLRHLGA